MLLGMLDVASETLTVRRPYGQIYSYSGPSIRSGGH